MATHVINVSRQKIVESKQVNVGTADTAVTTFTAAQKVNRVVISSNAAAGFKFSIQMNGDTPVAATNISTTDAVGHNVGLGTNVDTLEIIAEAPDYISSIRGWASAAQNVKITAYSNRLDGKYTT